MKSLLKKLKSAMAPRLCPLCGWSGREFLRHGNGQRVRDDARCPGCGSLERHRLTYYHVMNNRVGRMDSVLHVAPEKVIEKWLRSLSGQYLSIDLVEGKAMKAMDLTALDLPDRSQDLIWCSHVLEHIPDDAAAMREMARVLRPGGRAIIQVPIWREKTYEDWSVTTPEGRVEHFMQRDHVRLYGMDIIDRLNAAGLQVEVIDAKHLPAKAVRRYALSYHSTNQSSSPACKKASRDSQGTSSHTMIVATLEMTPTLPAIHVEQVGPEGVR